MIRKHVVAAAVAALGLVGAGFWLGNAHAATAEPGSADDPLVTKSYVDQLVASLANKAYVDQATAGLAEKSYLDARVADLTAKGLFQVVRVPKGQTLIGESGTEVVLRGGKATAVVSKQGGLLDATDGADVWQGEAVKPNHLLIIPVSDGRGLTAQADLILIVKGSYTVKASEQ